MSINSFTNGIVLLAKQKQNSKIEWPIAVVANVCGGLYIYVFHIENTAHFNV